MADPKKPSMALVIEAARKGKSDDDAPDSSPESERGEDEDYSASVAELADALDIPDDKREAFTDAFRAAVMACSK